MKTVFAVSGLRCASCQAHIEKAVRGLRGVRSAEVNLVANTLTVEYDPEESSSDDVIRAVRSAGFDASVRSGNGRSCEAREKISLIALWGPVVFLIPLMLLSMHGMFGIPLPRFLEGCPRRIGLVELLLLVPVVYWNFFYFRNGFRSLVRFAPNMDTLVALGAGAGIVYSLLLLAGFPPGAKSLYFDASGMILVLITFGKYFEGRTRRHAGDAIARLVRLAPETASVEREGAETILPVPKIVPGDIVILRPGSSVPVDGIVTDGASAVDESAVTGEGVPVPKSPGDRVLSGTVNTEGFLKFRAEKVGGDTTLAKIIALVEEAGAKKAPSARIADRVSAFFVPAVIGIALTAFVVWLLAGQTFAFALSVAITVLLISCPCALGLATPLAVMAGTGRGAEEGILFRSGEALETLRNVTVFVFDKTGTLTTGHFSVTDFAPAPGIAEEELLSAAASVEAKSQHPFARAVLECARAKNVSPVDTENFELVPGRGVTVRRNGVPLFGGNADFLSERCPSAVPPEGACWTSEGKSVLYFAEEGKYLGAIALADGIRPDAADAILHFHEMNIRTVMLTGDNAETARAVAARLSIHEFHAGILPQDKERIIRELRRSGECVAMAGDGINDAPALTSADVGIAVGNGTDIALDSADVVLMHSDLSSAVNAVLLSRAVVRNIHLNLFWAFFYNVLGIPLAAGVFYPAFGWLLTPVWGAVAMCASSFCVVLNALRLRHTRGMTEKKS